jgi:hypothetical protein
VVPVLVADLSAESSQLRGRRARSPTQPLTAQAEPAYNWEVMTDKRSATECYQRVS